MIFRGSQVDAKYNEVDEPMHKHNAFIEALPPIMDSAESAMRMRRRPKYNEKERFSPPEFRLQAVQRIANFVEPLPSNLDLEQRFSRMIRNGYLTRNPIEAEWKKQLHSGFSELFIDKEIQNYEPIIRSSAAGFCMLGTSGVGKTTSVESVLSLYPQVINHSDYKGTSLNHKQLVWLKLECPHDGSIKGLCLNFFQSIDFILGTSYYKKFANSRRTVDELLPLMADLAFTLGLGVLVIDEINRLNEANSGGAAKMLNFFVQLINTIGVPVVLIGTFKSLLMIRKEFAQARRAAGQGDLMWANFAHDEVWDYFIENLWRYQWTAEETPLTPELSRTLYEESQGIPDIAVKLYMISQWHVIGESEKLTVGLIKEVAKESFKIARPILEALKKRDIDTLTFLSDIIPPKEDLDLHFHKAKERIAIEGTLNTLKNQQKAIANNESNSSIILEVAQWLVEAGVETNTAFDCATRSIERNGKEYDLLKTKQEAFILALSLNIDLKKNDKKPATRSKKNKKTKDVFFPGDLRGVLENAKKEGKNPYEAFKETGLLQSAREFLVM